MRCWAGPCRLLSPHRHTQAWADGKKGRPSPIENPGTIDYRCPDRRSDRRVRDAGRDYGPRIGRDAPEVRNEYGHRPKILPLLLSCIGASVIKHDQLPVAEALRLNASYRRPDHASTVPGRHYDAYDGRGEFHPR